jgi:ATP-dependent helicase/nuclease subunit B
LAVTLLKKLPRGLPPERAGDVGARIEEGRARSFFLVVPTRRKIRDAQRELLLRSPEGATPALRIFTLETLAAEICRLLVPPKRLLSPQMQAAFVQEAIRSKAPELRYFRLRGPAKRLPRGTLQKITGVINRMKETGVYLSVLDEEIEEGDASERSKLRDIHAIYGAYEELIAGGGYIDPPGLFKEANLAWSLPGSEERFRSENPGVDLLAVTGFDEFSDPEITLLHALSEIPGLSTVITFDYHPETDHLFGHLKENYRKFLSIGFSLSPSAPAGAPPFREFVARRLFSAGTGGKNAFDAGDIVSVHAATDRLREAELIAKIVKSTLADTPGIGPGDICVCMPNPEPYSEIFREVFEEAGVPANITDRFYLDQSSVVNGIVSLMLIAQNNFRIGDIMRAGTNPFLGLRFGPAPFDAPNILRAASELRVVGGRKRWFERIDARTAFLVKGHAEDDEDPRGADLREVERLARARTDLEGLDRLLGRFAAPMTPGEFSAAVESVVDGLGVAARIVASGSSGVRSGDVEREARAFVEFMNFLGEFPDVLSLESPPGEKRSLGWYLERFRPLLSQARYNVRQRFGEGVLITSINETRGLTFAVMIMAGLSDADFPSVHEPEIFLPARRRERRERYHLHNQRYLFYQALTNFTNRVFLTRPCRAGGVSLNPSGFLEALGAIATFPEYGQAADGTTVRDPVADVVASPPELLEYIGAGEDRPEDPGAGGENGGPDPVLLAHVAHAVRVEESRRADGGHDTFRGIIAGELGAAAAQRLGERRSGVYSVTQLETYGECPFRYFAGRQLRLRVTEKPEEGVSPRETGRLLHEILYDFYSKRREAGRGSLAGADDAEFRAAVDDILAIAREKFDETHVDDIFWEIATEGVLGGPGGPGSLEEMLRAEREGELTAVPSYFEVPFGRAGEDLKYRDPGMYAEDPVPAGGIRLAGKIDRVDMAGDAFRVIDYKTGSRLPGPADIEEGASLQLPLYLHCAASILSGRLGRVVDTGVGAYYHLRDGFRGVTRLGSRDFKGSLVPAGERSKLFDSAGRLRELVAAATVRATEHASNIADGMFPVRPSHPDRLCRSCEFNRVCRIRTRPAWTGEDHDSEPTGQPHSTELIP